MTNSLTAPEANTTDSWQWLPLAQIEFPEYQVRKSLEPEALQRLVETISTHGMLEPLVVRRLDEERYELVAGWRRYTAAQQVGWQRVPACVRELSDAAALELALQENLVREELNPLEETDGILRLLAVKLDMDVDGVVSLLYSMRNQKLGSTRRNGSPTWQVEVVESVFAPLRLSWKSFVETRLPLLKLPEDVLAALREGKIAYTKAKALAKLSDEENRRILLEEAIEKGLSLSQIRARVRSLREEAEDGEVAAKEVPSEVMEEVAGEESSSEEVPQPVVRLQAAAQRIQRTKLWQDPQRWQEAERLLERLEALVAEVEGEE